MALTQTFNFAPNNTVSPPYQFAFNANGYSYTCSAMYNFAGQRYYLVLYDQDNNLIINTPMVGSFVASPIDLLWGSVPNLTIIFVSSSATIIVESAS